MLVSEAVNYPILTWAAIVACYTRVVDPGGPVRARFNAVTTLGTLGAASCATSIWATSCGAWTVVLH